VAPIGIVTGKLFGFEYPQTATLGTPLWKTTHSRTGTIVFATLSVLVIVHTISCPLRMVTFSFGPLPSRTTLVLSRQTICTS
jgi:hypothetical protein